MKAQNKLVVANFKMNLSIKFELDHWLLSFKKGIEKFQLDKTQLILCPPEIYLDRFVAEIKSGEVCFGAQNCSWEQKGALTGEISPEMIKTVGGKYVILGHSERRRFLGENDAMVAGKIRAAFKANLKPVLCVGENEKEKKQELTVDVLKKQLTNCLADISRSRVEDMIICYEPVWAISANKPDHLPNSNEIMGAKLFIKKFLVENYGKSTAEKVRIIYGGSVDVGSAQEVCVDPGMDGALVGSASLRPYDLIKIAQIIDY